HEAFHVLDAMIAWLQRQPPGFDCTFQEYLERSDHTASQRNRATAYVEGFNAADSRRIGIAALARQQAAEDAIGSEHVFRLKGGYDSLPQYLHAAIEQAGAEVHLGAVVRNIDWRPGHVSVAAQTAGAMASFQAPQALIALPLGVLQSRLVALA